MKSVMRLQVCICNRHKSSIHAVLYGKKYISYAKTYAA